MDLVWSGSQYISEKGRTQVRQAVGAMEEFKKTSIQRLERIELKGGGVDDVNERCRSGEEAGSSADEGRSIHDLTKSGSARAVARCEGSEKHGDTVADDSSRG